MDIHNLSLRDEARLILGFPLPEDMLQWEPKIKALSVSGIIDQNKKFNLVIMLLMRVAKLEENFAELERNTLKQV